MDKTYYSAAEAAVALGMTPAAVRKQLRLGQMKGWHVNRSLWLVSREEIARRKELIARALPSSVT